MTRDIVVTVSVLISALFVILQLYFRFVWGLRREAVRHVLLGAGFGLAGAVLLAFPIYVDDFPIDIRAYGIIMATLYGGPVGGMTASGIVGIGSLVSRGTGVDGIGSASICLLMGAAFAGIMRLNASKWMKWLYMNLFVLASLSLLVFIMLPGSISIPLYVASWLMTTTGGALAKYFIDNQYRSNETMLQLEQLAATDALTGIGNRRAFQSKLAAFAREGRTGRKPYALLSLDIDFFKRINDTFGHPAGDEVLRQFADLMKTGFPPSALLYRNGGEEFAVLLPGAGKGEATSLAEKFRLLVEKRRFPLQDGHPDTIAVTVSIGVGVPARNGGDPERLIREADKALYLAKQTGRNRVVAS